jgi:hypothetical protein
MLMAKDLLRCVDPAQLMRDAADIEPDGWQLDLLCSASKRILMCCARQVGKTEGAIIKTIWTSLFDPGLVIIVSPSQRQSSEFFRRFMERYRVLEGVPELVAESALRCELSNGSRILALPGGGEGKTIRGLSAVRLCIVDEAARCEDELFAAIRPMLGTSDGSLIMLSTPAGRQGEFHRAWVEGGDTWTRVSVRADQCPRLSEEFLREERAQLGDLMFRQEFLLEFLADSERVFDVDLFKQAFSHPECEVFF